MLTFAFLVSVIGVVAPSQAQSARSPGQISSSRVAPVPKSSEKPKSERARSANAVTKAPAASRSDPAGTVPQGAPGTEDPTIPAQRHRRTEPRPRG